MITKAFKTLTDLSDRLYQSIEYQREYYKTHPYFAVARGLYDLRKSLGLTQQELADKAGTHQSRLSKLESADLDFKLSTLIAIADALDARVEISFVKYESIASDDWTKLFIPTTKTIKPSKANYNRVEIGEVPVSNYELANV